MTALRKKKHPKPTDRCIFCGGKSKLTGEHVWADLLRNYLARTEPNNFHWTMYQGGEPEPGILHRPGDAHSQKLKVVCGPCNNGWMSRLQEHAKPILVPLIQDDWPEIDESAQALFAAWAAMFTMVFEFADVRSATIPQEHRTALMNLGTVPRDWSIWIGRHDPGSDHPAFANHHGWLMDATDLAKRLTKRHYCQVTGFTVGRLYVQTVTITPPILVIEHEAFATAYDLRTIIPFRGSITSRPATALSRETRQVAANDPVRSFGFRHMTRGP